MRMRTIKTTTIMASIWEGGASAREGRVSNLVTHSHACHLIQFRSPVSPSFSPVRSFARSLPASLLVHFGMSIDYLQVLPPVLPLKLACLLFEQRCSLIQGIGSIVLIYVLSMDVRFYPDIVELMMIHYKRR